MTSEAINGFLASLYDELRAIAEDTEPTDDPRGERLRTVLIQLGWTEAAATTLRDEAAGNAVHTRPLAIPTNIVWTNIPADLAYDREGATLSFAGVMRDARLTELTNAVDAAGAVAGSDTTVSAAAITGARTAIRRDHRTTRNTATTIPDATFGRIVLPVSKTPLDWLPAAVVVPAQLAGQLRYDTTARMLTLLGDLTTADRQAMLTQRPTTLDAVQTERWNAFRDALDRAIQCDATAVATDEPKHLDATDDAAGARFRRLWRHGAPRDRLEGAAHRPGPRSGGPCRQALASRLPVPTIARNASSLAVLETTPTLLPSEDAVATIIRWHKIGLVARKLNLSGTQIEWLRASGDPLGFVRLTALPSRATERAAGFSDLLELDQLRDRP